MHIIKAVMLLCAFGLFQMASAQPPSNIHVASSVGASANNTTVGVTAGADFGNRVVISIDGSVVRAWKEPYRAGYQIEGRQTVRFYVSERVFVQGGATETYHQFGSFKPKITIAPLAGVGVASKDRMQLFGFNFRADLTSENRQRIFEGWAQVYGKNHFYGRAVGGVSNFIDGPQRTTSGFVRVEIGAWW